VRYCEGLPELGTRPFTGEERERVLRDHRLAVRRIALAAAGLAGPPGVAVAAVAVALALDTRGYAWATGVGAGGLIVALLLGVPLALLALRDAVRGLRQARGDLRGGVVAEYGDGVRTIVLLPRSGRALAEGGTLLVRPRPALVGEAAPVPEDGPTYAVSASAVPEGYEQYAWIRRALAPAELDEARAHAAKLARVSRVLVGLTVWVVLMGVYHAHARARSPEHDIPISGVAWAIGLAAGWFRTLAQRRLAQRLLEDVEEGWVVRATAGEAAGVEVLPASGLVWAEGASPLGWRLRRLPRKAAGDGGDARGP
jgi:hypothetical protein